MFRGMFGMRNPARDHEKADDGKSHQSHQGVAVGKPEKYQDPVAMPFVINAESTTSPAIVILPPQHAGESYMATIETVVERVYVPSSAAYRGDSVIVEEATKGNRLGRLHNMIADRPSQANEYETNVQTEGGEQKRTDFPTRLFQRMPVDNANSSSNPGTKSAGTDGWNRTNGGGTHDSANAWSRSSGGGRSDVDPNGLSKPDGGTGTGTTYGIGNNGRPSGAANKDTRATGIGSNKNIGPKTRYGTGGSGDMDDDANERWTSPTSQFAINNKKMSMPIGGGTTDDIATNDTGNIGRSKPSTSISNDIGNPGRSRLGGGITKEITNSETNRPSIVTGMNETGGNGWNSPRDAMNDTNNSQWNRPSNGVNDSGTNRWSRPGIRTGMNGTGNSGWNRPSTETNNSQWSRPISGVSDNGNSRWSKPSIGPEINETGSNGRPSIGTGMKETGINGRPRIGTGINETGNSRWTWPTNGASDNNADGWSLSSPMSTPQQKIDGSIGKKEPPSSTHSVPTNNPSSYERPTNKVASDFNTSNDYSNPSARPRIWTGINETGNNGWSGPSVISDTSNSRWTRPTNGASDIKADGWSLSSPMSTPQQKLDGSIGKKEPPSSTYSVPTNNSSSYERPTNKVASDFNTSNDYSNPSARPTAVPVPRARFSPLTAEKAATATIDSNEAARRYRGALMPRLRSPTIDSNEAAARYNGAIVP